MDVVDFGEPPYEHVVQWAAEEDEKERRKNQIDWTWVGGKLSILMGCVLQSYISISTVLESDAYAVLGVARSATMQQVRRAFRQQAALLHPDSVHHTPEMKERLEVLARARDEIVKGLGDPLAIALPEWVEAGYNDAAVIFAYCVFMFGVASIIYCIGVKWLERG